MAILGTLRPCLQQGHALRSLPDGERKRRSTGNRRGHVRSHPGKRLKLSEDKIRSAARSGALYAYPRERSIRRFKDQVRALTKRRVPLSTKELIEELNPVLRGWGHYYKRVHVRKLFHRLDCWIVRRIWSHRCKRWRNRGWKQLPWAALYSQYGLVSLVGLIPSRASHQR